MENNVLYKKIKKNLAMVLNIDSKTIKPENTLNGDLGADSIDIVSLVAIMEEELDQTLDIEQLQKLSTVRDIVQFIGTMPNISV